MIDERARPERPPWPFDRVLDWITDGCVLFDRRLDCLYANQRASAVFGVPPDRLVGRSLHSHFPTTLAAEFQRVALPAFANRTAARATLHDEAADRWLEATLHPSTDGLLAIIADITAAKRTGLEDAAHTEYLQQLVDQIPAFLWVIDRDLIVRRAIKGDASP
jgi:PAS domain-containing protein